MPLHRLSCAFVNGSRCSLHARLVAFHVLYVSTTVFTVAESKMEKNNGMKDRVH